VYLCPAFEFPALGCMVLEFQALEFLALEFQALEFQVLGYPTMGYPALEYQAMEFVILLADIFSPVSISYVVHFEICSRTLIYTHSSGPKHSYNNLNPYCINILPHFPHL